MELKNDFVVDRPVSETWKILTNLELIAPCLPGARLEEVEGEEYRGSVSVKVGPITGKYKGKASFIEQDEANRVARLRAEGRDPRQGNANALITAAMVAAGADGNQTRVDLTTDLGLSGKIASFARGNLEDVSRKLLTQFAENLEQMLIEEDPERQGVEILRAWNRCSREGREYAWELIAIAQRRGFAVIDEEEVADA